MTKWTVIGYWDDDGDRAVTGVVEGWVDVYGGDSCSEGGPFAEQVEASGYEEAAMMVDGHEATPGDGSEPGDWCKICGEPVTWTGPAHTDWKHVGEN